MPDDHLAIGIAALDEALASAPKRNGDAFSKAVRSLSAFRDEIIATEGRTTENSRRRLVRINAVLSLVMAGHFPLGAPPWDEIRKTRGWLTEMLETA